MQLFVKDLTVIDASYLCPERGMVGQSWIVDVILIGGLDEQSMVLDFGLVKKKLKQIIDREVDHRLLVPAKLGSVTLTSKEQGMIALSMATQKGDIHLYCPEQGVAQIPAEAITAQSVTDYLQTLIKPELPENVQQLQLTLREEVINTPCYHYSHGLKKHDGNCQRIAHGHRSMIEIWQGNSRDDELEAMWAKRWDDIYLGSEEDVTPVEQLQLANWVSTLSEQEYWGFAYQAPQGLFELAISNAVVEIIDTDTTVECLADYILKTLKSECGAESPLKVLAYEGVGKGAIASDS